MEILNIERIELLSVHKVGNKSADEGCVLASRGVRVTEEMNDMLSQYFTGSFTWNEWFQFYHETELKYNEVYGYLSEIFENCETLHEQSVHLAKHLYEKSEHPKIKGGEFYVVYFSNCMMSDGAVAGIGLFKSENKDTFLKVQHQGEGFEIESQQGINIKKLDKGAIILNIEKEHGYMVTVVDNTNRGSEAHYWLDAFLHVRQRQDEYYNTKNVIALTKNFVTKELPREFEGVSKADQVDLLNRSAQFFKEKESFDMEEFANEVIVQPEVIESFNRFRESFAQERDIDFEERFAISDSAAKKGARTLKSVIKLDKNFHIYIHGDRSKIETGQDDKGKYYKVYYEQEQ